MKLEKPVKRAKPKRRIKSKSKRKAKLSLMKQCAILWSRWIRRNGTCEFLGEFVGCRQHLACSGGLQAMHGFGKKAYPGVRFAVWNGFSGCGAVHAYYTWRPPEWENYLRSRWGEEEYQRRLREAMAVRKYDLEQVVATFRAALSGVEVVE